MQRATTALEAAGLVRKKSAEAVREEKEKEKERAAAEKRVMSGEEPRASHGSGSSKLMKTPPMKPTKDAALLATPPPGAELSPPQTQTSSPWVLTGSKHSPPTTPSPSPGDTLTSLPNIGNKVPGGHRNRASLLSTFRMWFKEDPKGKRKEEVVIPSQNLQHSASLNNPGISPVSPRNRGTVRRRTSTNHGKSWGLEPPGWQTRSAYPAVEVLAIYPPDGPLGIRDVFSGRQSLSMGDESDWVDEEDDSPGYVGGLGQMPSSAGSTITTFSQAADAPLLSPSPRGVPPRSSGSKRTTSSSSGLTAGTFLGETLAQREVALLSDEAHPSRRIGLRDFGQQGRPKTAATGRSGPAFRHPIQEEDEGEEE
ncbi:hypothetical protein A0H81_01965 [Grifola frondosa]|uniref:Uncharacterized protein n=1 Tax=Grifola frondosa TaxID=5627 RepID=A0A1C7MP46_GRIFR|nr:hypothetical protein A0H81_01965 [Grifola frondosa]